VIEVRGESYAFKYAEQFAGLDAVADWARANPTALCDNTARVDGIVSRNNASAATNSLLAQTLHTWLCCTWYGTRGDGLAGSRRSDRDWYGVWEGSCYLMSTVDVEYTQAPFYLAVWPELLRLQLDHWPHYARDGRVTLGERGAGTAFLCHDSGGHATANGNVYSHDMEVEENANYIILAYAYWRRTGDDGPLQRHGEAIGQYLEFLARCDTTGNGVPDRGVANTIDDASPAVQFGREQMYLGAKTLAAFVAGSVILRHLGREPEAQRFDVQAGVLRGTLETAGWLGDHFATLLEKRGVLKNPWSGEEIPCEEIPGWDAAHIYTVNGLALLDMVGLDTGLDRDKLTTDLHTATARCLREYGCVHSDFANTEMAQLESMLGLVGVARAPGWIAMNLLRDIAAFYRGVDLRGLAERYWNWQTTTNTQEPKLFFETFAGNNLCFYPRGIAAWGYFDALGGVVIDRVASVDARGPAFSQTRVPVLLTADWANGTSEVVEG
jgi:hypothetical protein